MTTYFDKLKITERLRSGMLASGFGFSVNLVSQVALVPILLFFWGQELFGEWVILSAVPAYLSLSNLDLAMQWQPRSHCALRKVRLIKRPRFFKVRGR